MGVNVAGGGSLPRGGGGEAIQVAYKTKNRDATTPTPRESPLTVSTTVLELKTPANAVVLVMFAGSNNLRFGDNATLDGTANKGYFVLTAGNFVALPVASAGSVWVKRDGAADVIVSFYYEMLES